MLDKMDTIPSIKPHEIEKKVQERLSSIDADEKVKDSRKGGKNYYSVHPPLLTKDDFNWDDIYNMFLYDTWNRFMSMRTFNVRHGLGFDPYNLRVERSVLEEFDDLDKGLGSIYDDNWDDIVEKIEDRSDKFKDLMTEELEKLGLWLDKENEYETNSDSFIDSIWWTVKELIEKGHLTKEEKPVTWCPKCKSAVVDTEISQKEMRKEKALIKVPTAGGKNRYFLLELEDPWKLPAATTISVDTEQTYAVVKHLNGEGETEQLLLRDDKIEDIMGKKDAGDYSVINRVDGEKLEGLSFRYPLLDKVPAHEEQKGHRIISSDKIDHGGTGLIFLTPPHDEEHWKLAKERDLPIFDPVAKNGYYGSGLNKNKYSGLSVSKIDQIILDDLMSKDLIFSRKMENKEVEFCGACLNMVIKLPHREWFFKVDGKDQKIENHMDNIELISEDENLEVKDWVVTREKRWGISFPLWRCKCGNHYVPSDKSGLTEAADLDEDISAKPDKISKVKIKCEVCNKEMLWEGKILNPLFIQSASIWSQLGYPHDEIEYQSWWPGQIFITKKSERNDLLTAAMTLSSALFEEDSLEKILVQGPILSDIDYKDVRGLTEKEGYDSLRLYMFSGAPLWESRKIQGNELQYPHPLIRVIWNLKNFLKNQLRDTVAEPSETTLEFVRKNMNIEDEWILSRVESAKTDIKEAYKKGRYDIAIELIQELVMEDMAQWYIGRAEKRLEDSDDEDVTSSILKVIYEALTAASKMILPVAPFIAEDVYNEFDGRYDSVFMFEWPDPNNLLQNEELEEDMEEVKGIVSEIKSLKRRHDMSERHLLKNLVYKAKDVRSLGIVERFDEMIKEKAKVKNIDIVEPGEEWDEKILEIHTNEEAIGKTYQQWKSRIATMLEQREPKEVKNGVENGDFTIGIQGQIIEIRPEMVSFKTDLPEGYEEINREKQDIFVDMNVYEEIEDEVKAQETMLRLKSMRKDFDLEEEDEIKAFIECSEEMAKSLRNHEDRIKDGAKARSIDINEEEMEDIEYVYEWHVEGEEVEIGIIPLYKNKLLEYYQTFTGIGEKLAENLYEHGYTSIEDLAEAPAAEIFEVKGMKRSVARGVKKSLEEESVGSMEDIQEEVFEVETAPKEKEKMVVEGDDREKGEEYASKTGKTQKVEGEEEIKTEEGEDLPEGLSKSSTYLIDESKADESDSFELFKKILETGNEGLCVTRDYPDKVREKYGLEGIEIIWLSNVDREDVVRPKSLEKFSLTIENFLTRKKGVILLNGVEYLITNNDFRTVLHLIQSLKDQVAINRSILMIPVNPTTLEENQVDLLSSEVDKVIEP